MKKNSAVTAIVLIVLICAMGIFYFLPLEIGFNLSTIEEAGFQLATALISRNAKSVKDIQSHYDVAGKISSKNNKVRVLIAPGHEPTYGGSEYADLKERNMAVELGQNLERFLANDPHYQVFVTRNSEEWSPVFSKYFEDNWNDIAEWTNDSREEFFRLVAIGSIVQTIPTVIHNNALGDVAMRLYGITKWSNENKIDIAINIHFNDNPRARTRTPGKYSGFSIYVPASEFGNSKTTKVIAEKIFERLAKYSPVSDHKGEATGIIDDPELIAVGVNNTADAVSILIEYSYIYEPQFKDPQTRRLVIEDLAYQTYLGLQDFFDKKIIETVLQSKDTTVLPHIWESSMIGKESSASDIFALQTALMVDGVYPPIGKSKNECPRTGIFGPCTRAALDALQNNHGIRGENGVAGKKTLEVLDSL